VKDLLKRQPLGAASLAVAVVALSVALVGTSFAGGGKVTTKKLANNAVTTKKVANNAITTAKLGDGAVTSAKLGNGAVTSAKLGDGAVTSAKLGDGAVTSAKLAGGAVTATKLGLIQAAQKNLGVGALASNVTTVDCPAGTTVISGGAAYQVTNVGQDIQIRSSFRDGNGWRVAVVNNGAGSQNYTIEAYCLVG
jgi:hypothetical protein